MDIQGENDVVPFRFVPFICIIVCAGRSHEFLCALQSCFAMKEAFETRSVDAMLIRVFVQWMAVSSVVASPNAQGRNRCRRRYRPFDH